uniref:Putative conserved secreted protein n=1 Tax=Culex tarsalis TaxID=7177 RepID=A0A1Q3FTU1_CULTA
MSRVQVTIGLLLAVLVSCQARHTNEQIMQIQPHYDICVERNAIKDAPKVADAGLAEFVTRTDDASKKVIQCVLLRLNLIDCQGTVKRKRFESFYEDGHAVDKLPGVINGCNQKKGSALERTFNFYKCFFEQKTFVI